MVIQSDKNYHKKQKICSKSNAIMNDMNLNFTWCNKVDYDFSEYRSLKKLFKAIYYRNIKIEKAERIQEEFSVIIDALKKYKSKNKNIKKQRKTFN